MIEKKDIDKLAELSRIELGDAEKEKLQGDLEAIIGYVSMLKDAPVSESLGAEDDHINIMREDTNPIETGFYTKKILDDAPKVEDDFVVVKQIIGEKGAK